MKKIIKSVLLLLAIIIMLTDYLSISAIAQTSSRNKISYQSFYDNLSPYGTWIEYPGYGHVWNPRVEGDFRPYATNGNWIYTDEGWAWASNYSWGWAPFHYGRWIYDDSYGWLWIPGYDWSPAWVTWGVVDNYYCWAPLMPEVDVVLQFNRWMPHPFYWNIVSRNHLFDRNISNVLELHDHMNTFINRISIMNNFNTTRVNKLYYSRGPELNEVTRYTNQKIESMSVRDVRKMNKVGQQGKVINVYRPQVENPRPNEFKKAEPDKIRPIRDHEQVPSVKNSDQRNNIEQLPTHRSTTSSDKKSPNRQSGDKRNR